MQISELCYELYKIDWLKRISAERRSDALKDYYQGLVDDSTDYTFDDYIEEFGYNGELYVCYEEFIDNEYQEDSYIYDYCPSSTNRDYSPSNPWDAPGMSIRDFI